MTIQAKPTVYRGIQFKSRLEARWAVFLSHHPAIKTWAYEPYTFKLQETGWTYTPDFQVIYKYPTNIANFLLEVKPKFPNDEYLKQLIAIARGIPHTLCLGIGDFYNEVPRITDLTNDLGCIYPLSSFALLPSSYHAISTAKSHRFDLEDEQKPARTQSIIKNIRNKIIRFRRRKKWD